MFVVGAVAAVAIWVWTQALPGYLLSRTLAPELRGIPRLFVALVIGFAPVPLAIFLLSVAGGIPMDAPLIFAVASAINVAAAGAQGADLWRRPDATGRQLGVVTAVFLGLTVFIVFFFRAIDAGDVLTTIQHCLYVIALHGIQNDPSTSLPLWDSMTGDFMHFLIHHDESRLAGLGELLYEQRLGNVPTLGLPVAVLGMAGFWAATLHAGVITALGAFLCARRAGATVAAALIGAFFFTWGVHVLCQYTVNENLFATAMAAYLLWVALDDAPTRALALLAGLVAGHLVGLRHTSVLFVPALFLALATTRQAGRIRLQTVGLAAVGAVAAVAPWLYINLLKLGSMFTHPKVQPDSGGRVVVNHWPGGGEFLFKPLQWPFTSEVVRTVWNPFPTFLWLPLLIARSFGHLACALCGPGLVTAWRTRRRLVWILAVFALPHHLALSLLEGVDWEQITYAAPGLLPLPILLALGVDWLRPGPDDARAPTALRRRAVIALAVTAVIAGGSRSLRGLDFPVDTRLVDPTVWAEAPPKTAEIASVAERLTPLFAPLPELPTFRLEWARRLPGTLSAVARRAKRDTSGDVPVYPSGRVVVLSAYSQGKPRHYHFQLKGRPLREPGTPFRSAVWLHTVAFRFAAERLDVKVVRLQGRYQLDLTPIGETAEARDFTFRLNPWYPPIRSIELTVDGERSPDVRILPWGGTLEDGERMHLVTNYPPEIVDTIEVPYTIDLDGSPAGCGIWIFLADVDGTSIETLSPGGATDLKWHGETSGVLVLPRPLLAESLVLFSEPYCSDHIPQVGDRFGVTYGPFGNGKPIELKLDRVW